MQFNTYPFLFVFLPLTLTLFWADRGPRWRMASLVAASYAFYFYWDYLEGLKGGFTALLVGSTAVNYFAGKAMVRLLPDQHRKRKLLLIGPIALNLTVLAVCKYAVFAWGIAGDLLGAVGGGMLPQLEIILPIGISFYTFEAISYIVDVYYQATKPAPSFLEYACFISMFPREISGPIVRYSDLEEQFVEKRAGGWRKPDWRQINVGLMLLTMGMAKKVLVADRIAEVINPIWNGMSSGGVASAPCAWAAVLGYTFQLYFDFSGYSDMAVGLGHFFGMRLPQNFNSPYKATDARDFWRRWHMTLSAWLRDYLYIPLGGNRTGHRARNVMITMLLGGLWHGAAWQFVMWGGWHGLLLIAYRILRDRRWMPSDENPVARFFNRQMMFFWVIIGWVLFRSPNLQTAAGVFRMLAGIGPDGQPLSIRLPGWYFPAVVACWLWCNVAPNSFEVAYRAKHRAVYAVLAGVVLAVCVFYFGSKTDFLYFQF